MTKKRIENLLNEFYTLEKQTRENEILDRHCDDCFAECSVNTSLSNVHYYLQLVLDEMNEININKI